MLNTFSRYTFIFIVLLLVGFTSGAQQLFKISNYMPHNFINNPATSGAEGHTTLGGVYRSQWTGIEGGPQTTVLFGDTWFSSASTGVGAVLYSDKTGPTSRTGGELNVSYGIKLSGDEKRLMFGLGLQAIQFKIDKAKIAASIPNDPLLSSSGNSTKGDVNAGVYFRSNTWNIGFAAKQLIETKLKLIESSTNTQGKLYRHFLATASYDLKTDEDNILQPHAEIRFQPNAPVDFEGGLTLYHKDLLHIGASAHYNQAYTLFAGVKLQHKFLISYAYDTYKNPVSYFDGGFVAHEIMLRYLFGNK